MSEANGSIVSVERIRGAAADRDMASSSPTSNPDLSQNLNTLSLSEPIDPWSRPIDDNDPDDPTLATNPPPAPPKGGNADSAPVGSDELPPLPAETPPFASSEPKVHVDQAVLDEFDPLGNKVEREAKTAWEQSEPHPPVPPKSSPPQYEPPTQDEPVPLPTNTRSLPPPAPIPVPDPIPAPPAQTITDKPLPDPNSTTSTTQDPPQPVSRSSTPTLSGLAAIARTFIPISPTRTSRPLSIDQATAILSPTAATFGAHPQEQGAVHKRPQSQGQTPSSLDPEAQSKRDEDRPQTPGSAPRTPRSAARDVDQPPPFDFQSFLEQMKSKGAEPVAKYLRSCAPQTLLNLGRITKQ